MHLKGVIYCRHKNSSCDLLCKYISTREFTDDKYHLKFCQNTTLNLRTLNPKGLRTLKYEKGMYRLREAAILAHDKLKDHLEKYSCPV